LAYKITGDKVYLGKIYYYYLVYKGAQNTQYSSRYEIHDEYYRGCVIGLWLDNLIQKETSGTNSIEDVIGYLYQKYKNTGHEISIKDLEEATDLITKQNNSALYEKYVDGDENIPFDEYMQPYKESFEAWLKVLESDNWGKEYHGYSIPFFIDVEISIRSSIDLPLSILILSHYEDFVKYALKNYDVDKITKNDVETALSKLTGEDCTGFFERWKDSYGELSLEEMKDWLKSYLPYVPKNFQATFENNHVTLKWDQVEWRYPSGYYEITGYAIYRGTSKGEEALIATVGPSSSPSFIDTNIEPGKTYYYYVKSIENLYQEIPVYSEPSERVSVICKQFSITSSSTPGGSISPSGTITVNYGDSKTFTITPDKGYKISDVKVDGKSVGAVSTYTFEKVIDNHTIEVTFEKQVTQMVIVLKIGSSSFTVNGETRYLDSPPVIKNSRTLVPIRPIVEALGGTVGWDGTERKVTISLGSTVIELWIGKNTARVNGMNKPIDSSNPKVVPEIINGMTMLPLRFVTENLGCQLQWDPNTQTITITYRG
jgi:hypothetical protein